MSDLAKETLEKIRKEKIKPDPKWKFLLRDYAVWSFCLFLILAGSIATGLMFYLTLEMDWDIFLNQKHPGIRMFFGIIPYFWLITLSLLIFLFFLIFKKTKKGYRYSGILVVSAVIFLFFTLGSFLHFSKFSQKFHGAISERVPRYEKFNNFKEAEWSKPEFGFLGGKITKIEDLGFNLEDFKGSTWMIFYDNNTIMKCPLPLKIENIVKVIGTKLDEENFRADEIRPWEGRGMRMNKFYFEK